MKGKEGLRQSLEKLLLRLKGRAEEKPKNEEPERQGEMRMWGYDESQDKRLLQELQHVQHSRKKRI